MYLRKEKRKAGCFSSSCAPFTFSKKKEKKNEKGKLKMANSDKINRETNALLKRDKYMVTAAAAAAAAVVQHRQRT